MEFLHEFNACRNSNEKQEFIQRLLGKNAILKLMQSIQSIDRSTEDFSPLPTNSTEALQEADDALILLLELFRYIEEKLLQSGWFPKRQGMMVGSTIYQNASTSQCSENPCFDGMTWHDKLLMQLPLLYTPFLSKNNSISWVVTIIYIDSECYFSVLDVVKTDVNEEPDKNGMEKTVVCRELVQGIWTGLQHISRSENDLSLQIGTQLESWVDTTMVGFTLLQKPDSILLLGISGPAIPNFISTNSLACLTCCDPSSSCRSILETWFNIMSPILDHEALLLDTSNKYSIVIVDLFSKTNLEIINQALQVSQTVIINLSRCQSLLPSQLVNWASQHKNQLSLEFLCPYQLRDDIQGQESQDLIAICRATGTPFKCTFSDWQTHMLNPSQATGAMDLMKAQETCVVSIPNFLSPDEIDSIHKLASLNISGPPEIRGRDPTNQQATWTVNHLQTNGNFNKQLPALRRKIMDTLNEIDISQQWNLFCDSTSGAKQEISIRVAEYHSMGVSGHLSDPKHYDADSLITIDIMLSDPTCDFSGGQLHVMEHGFPTPVEGFNQGTAVVFISHKQHSVTKVTSGMRHVLVIEVWLGGEKECSHRCVAFNSDCKTVSSVTHGGLPFTLACVSEPVDGKDMKGGIQSDVYVAGYFYREIHWQPTPGQNVIAPEISPIPLEAWDMFD